MFGDRVCLAWCENGYMPKYRRGATQHCVANGGADLPDARRNELAASWNATRDPQQHAHGIDLTDVSVRCKIVAYFIRRTRCN